MGWPCGWAWLEVREVVMESTAQYWKPVWRVLEPQCQVEVSDLLGVSARRMLTALSEGETDPAKLAAMAEPGLRATPEQLCDALRAAPSLYPGYRHLLKQYLERIQLQDRPIAELEQEMDVALKEHEDGVVPWRMCPAWAQTQRSRSSAKWVRKRFPTAANLCSWVGSCPGQEESAEQSTSDHSPKGNRSMRRILNQAANAAIKTKGTVFEAHYRRIRGRDPKKHNVAVWAVANRLCRLIWKILHHNVKY